MKQCGNLSQEPIEVPDPIRIIGARTHNLRQIDVEIPIGKLTVITGVSGSGKSSLAFNTIFAEGRRRFLLTQERVSGTGLANQLPDLISANVDFIDGLPPVLCVEQRTRGARKRSTVATISDLYDYLRLLFARVGQLHCPTCQKVVTSQSRDTIVARAMQSHDRQKVIVLAPIVRQRAGLHADVFARIVKEGFVRARVDGELIDAAAPPELAKSKTHDIEVVVDRLVMKPGIQSRLEESLDTALELGQGQCVLSYECDGGWKDSLYSNRLSCSDCGISFPPLEPRSFSFHSAIGACSHCEGQGTITQPDESEAMCDQCMGTRLSPVSRGVLVGGISIAQFCAMTPSQAEACIERWSRGLIDSIAIGPDQADGVSRLEGNLPAFNPRPIREDLNSGSQRLSGSDGASPSQKFAVPTQWDTDAPTLNTLRHILPEIMHRLNFLVDVGLDYLTLDRGGETLSLGEFQRTRLAACLGNELTGVCYILDEPTAGLHATDTSKLLDSLVKLRDQGNTVVLVEHDLQVIQAADYVIDLGPGAGINGGRVLATGTPAELTKNPDSITGPFLKPSQATLSEPRSQLEHAIQVDSDFPTGTLRLTGASLHNLKNVSVDIPLQKIVCVTGVSGSGKTSLVMQTLVPAIRQALGEQTPTIGPFAELKGAEQLSRIVQIDQSPLGRSARSTPATYSGMWDDIRKVFAKTKESRLRGFTVRQFSLNIGEARCRRCAGRGVLSVDERRFADWQIRCPDCNGKRFGPSTLSVRYRDRTVADVLEMSFAEAGVFFENFPRLAQILRLFNELGLGYLKLGQSAATLSGGEAQRVKLATELAKTTVGTGNTLYILDEPTAGLHVADVGQLVTVLRRLVAEGQSILVVEHNQELIAAADWEIEVGPGAGRSGGQIIRQGPIKNWHSKSHKDPLAIEPVYE